MSPKTGMLTVGAGSPAHPRALVEVRVDALQVVAHRLDARQPGADSRARGGQRAAEALHVGRLHGHRPVVEAHRLDQAGPHQLPRQGPVAAAPPRGARCGAGRRSARGSPRSCPSATSWPFTSTSTRGAIRSTSCRTWEDTTTVRPSSPSRRMSSTTVRALGGVEAVEGLVQQQQLGVVGQRLSQLHALAHAVGEALQLPPATSGRGRPRRGRARRRPLGVGAPRAGGAQRRPPPRGERTATARRGRARCRCAGMPRGSGAVGPQHAHGSRARLAKPAQSFRAVDLPAPLWPSRPVTPGPEGEGDVRQRHRVAVPPRDAVEHERGRFTRVPAGSASHQTSAETATTTSQYAHVPRPASPPVARSPGTAPRPARWARTARATSSKVSACLGPEDAADRRRPRSAPR